ncbi:LysE family transporter [Pseudorhodoferax sp. Leaf274]|uniref:LysE family transporter n=1 Tax=Pseudorhodoferax sp. Leaf274 TaxID=1736318 RepID=UPI0007033007|nr:LysE family transporter [Pseudorhodoferax sp. Leaf274]KQP49418.1 amino acid transporter [Pseudorhodoferax sp. Leaf274]
MTELLAVITITVLAVVSPGPDFAMVTRNSLLLSRRAGVLTALGIALGVLVHVGYTMLGVALLVQQSPALYRALQLAGAAYLVWLGLGMLRARAGGGSAATGAAAMPALSDAAALRVGFLTNVLNPKTMVFIVSLFMQVVQPGTPAAVQWGYGLFIAGAHLAWFALVAMCFSASAVRSRLLAVRHWIDRAFGGVLVGLGLLLALARGTR